MKKVVVIIVSIFLVSLAFTSCKPRKPTCPAYGQNKTENQIIEQDKNV
ncbi:MAG: hypothetical protein PHT69_03255 [Bacteroidales bacterium]|nr:hypothetical protein [Bacteroidales bacterium]